MNDHLLLTVQHLVKVCESYKDDEAHFTNDSVIDSKINDIVNYPHLFVLACLMDKQIKAERAWAIPYLICKDLCNGDFSFSPLANLSEEVVKSYFQEHSLHRFNNTMSNVFIKAVHRIKEKYNEDASQIWAGNNSSA